MPGTMLKTLVASLAGLGLAAVLVKYWGRWVKSAHGVEENAEEGTKERKEEEERPDWQDLEWTMETVIPFSDDSWAVQSTEDKEGRTFLIVKRRHEPLSYVLFEEKYGVVETRSYQNFDEIRPRPPREPMSKISTVMEFNSFLSKVEASHQDK